MRSPAPALLLVLSLGILGCQSTFVEEQDLGPRPGDGDAAEDLTGADLAGRPEDLRASDLGKSSLTPGTSTLTLMVAGVERSAVLYVPAGIAGGPLPLVIALHGNGDTNGNFVQALGLRAIADGTPFVLLAAQGISQVLTIGTQTIRVSWDAYRAAGENIDLPFLQALRQRLLDSGSIDARRVSLFGYSQGGYMAFRAGMDGARDLSCTAVCAAANPLPGSRLIANAAREIPVALQIGTLDPALMAARQTRAELEQNRHAVQYREIAGAGHVPFPGDPRTPLNYCLGQHLP